MAEVSGRPQYESMKVKWMSMTRHTLSSVFGVIQTVAGLIILSTFFTMNDKKSPQNGSSSFSFALSSSEDSSEMVGSYKPLSPQFLSYSNSAKTSSRSSSDMF